MLTGGSPTKSGMTIETPLILHHQLHAVAAFGEGTHGAVMIFPGVGEFREGLTHDGLGVRKFREKRGEQRKMGGLSLFFAAAFTITTFGDARPAPAANTHS